MTSSLHFVVAFVLATFLMGGIYILNQIVDIESDRLNKKLYLLSEGHIPVLHAWIELGVLFVVAWLLAIPFSIQFKIILFLCLIFGILYSVPPFKFKGTPIIDFVWNAVGFGTLAFSLGWVTGTPFSWSTIFYSMPYFFAIGGVFINTTIPDIEGDKCASEITTGVWLGVRKACWLSTGLIFVSLLLSIWLRDWICGIASIVALPLFVLAGLKHDLKSCFISTRVSGPIFVLLVGFKFWWFIPLLVLVVLSLRIYYKWRFNIIYPKIV